MAFAREEPTRTEVERILMRADAVLHRELLLQPEGRGQAGDANRARAGLDKRQEIRRDHFVPPLSKAAEWRQLWQIYIDDFDLAELFRTRSAWTLLHVQARDVSSNMASSAWPLGARSDGSS
eukprot:5435568-Amphidinium_carterae.2